ncbi:MAG: hypothetical protein IH624_15700 [Phycisphaerae bacterium]|nr:hypothetical protein [Phycisphaerae bacterium]
MTLLRVVGAGWMSLMDRMDEMDEMDRMDGMDEMDEMDEMDANGQLDGGRRGRWAVGRGRIGLRGRIGHMGGGTHRVARGLRLLRFAPKKMAGLRGAHGVAQRLRLLRFARNDDVSQHFLSHASWGTQVGGSQ